MTKIELSKIFKKQFNESLVHQVTVDFLSNQRLFTKGLKNRSDVSGGGAKPRPQKGSGRARAGTSRNPIWRGGGVTFAPTKNKSTKKINKKMYKNALNCILSELLRKKRLHVVKDLKVDKPKTKLFLKILKSLKIDNSLVVTDESKINNFLAARNIKDIEIISVNDINPFNLMKYDNVIIDSSIVEKLEKITS
ncbi:MAG: 50S ribosomal protein L4 [Gammaproteobacteria bacterium]|nr:50S ribosomal protein L4 [Gammaproteobacteria bacterium]|tara:strand:+ start:25359 stop:25937 length:579 start_codon:yes stop_codon:yes gene_type:complete